MEKVFVPLVEASSGIHGKMGGQGHAKHDAAYARAPKWLQKWHDDTRWAISLSGTWTDLLNIADAFGFGKGGFMEVLTEYRDKYGN